MMMMHDDDDDDNDDDDDDDDDDVDYYIIFPQGSNLGNFLVNNWRGAKTFCSCLAASIALPAVGGTRHEHRRIPVWCRRPCAARDWRRGYCVREGPSEL